jgi:hypothetical protein
MASLMNKGFMFDEVRRYIFNTTNMSNMKDVISFISSRTSNHENILKTGVYYHKRLRVIPKPHTVNIDYNTGTMVSQGQEYFVEMIASFSINDLKQYLFENAKINTTVYYDKRINGLLTDLVKRYGLEQTLFMIDTAIEDTYNNEYDNYLQVDKIINYYDKAMVCYKTAINNCKSNGGNIICPRKRF